MNTDTSHEQISSELFDCIIIGAGFSGLTVAYKLAKNGKRVLIVENEFQVGGLAADFEIQRGIWIERFYHHWFTSDIHITNLVKELQLESSIMELKSNTGMYFNRQIWKLSTPVDLIRFKPLPILSRIKLGLTIIKIRKISDWKSIEHLNIREWLEPIVGRRIYNAVWAPLVEAKFSSFSEEVSAAWIWKKLVLRGGSRRGGGQESLLYFQGGFGSLAREMANAIESHGGQILLGQAVTKINHDEYEVNSIISSTGIVLKAKQYVFTAAPQLLPEMMQTIKNNSWLKNLSKIQYLGNHCLVLVLNQSLSDTYWMNVNDPGFPFVGVIEHTNLVGTAQYDGKHIVYLSRYLDINDGDFALTDDEILQRAIPHLKRMFPLFSEKWLLNHYVWKSAYAQPITVRNYSKKIPNVKTPFNNLFLLNMAQIYPEDRGTNYAVRDATKLSEELLSQNG